MKIEIESVLEAGRGGTVVAFNSSLGKATGVWQGKEPLVNSEYDVEMDVPGVLVWEEDVWSSEGPESISEINGRTCLVGRVSCVDENGVVALELLEDIVFVEICNLPFCTPNLMLVCTPSLRLFDMNL